MPSPQSILNKLRPANAFPHLRRFVRWYLAPSGLLLAAALGLMLVASLGPGPSRVFAFVGVALMAIFLPYRFSRQQGFAADRASAIEAQSLRSQQEFSQRISALSARSKRQLSRRISRQELEAQSLRSQQQVGSAIARIDGQVSGMLETARVRTEYTGREVEVLQSRFALAEERLDAISDRTAATQEIVALSDRLTAAQAIVAGLDDRITATQAIVAGLDDRMRILAHGQQELSESLADDADSNADDPSRDARLVAEATSALRSDMALWAASNAGQSFSGVAMVVSPQRSGTTWAFDVLRSLPGASQMATSFIYRTLGVPGNRYPQDLADLQPAGEPIELRDGVGGFLPRLRHQTFGEAERDLLAVEKVHPSAFGFEPTALLRSLGGLERSLGRVQLVLLIRDPVDAYRSFVSYQQSFGWHTDIPRDSVAQLYASSLSTMNRLRRLHDDCLIVSYEDLLADPVAGYTNIAGRLGLKTDMLAVSRVLDAADEWRVQASSSPYFAGSSQPKAAKFVIGSGLLSETERYALEKARITYEELWTDRIL